MITGKVTVKVKFKGESEPRTVEVTGAYWKDEAELKAHFETHSPGCEFLGIVGAAAAAAAAAETK